MGTLTTNGPDSKVNNFNGNKIKNLILIKSKTQQLSYSLSI